VIISLAQTRAANDRALTARRAPPAVHAMWAKALCWPGGNARETREGIALLERAALEYKDLRYEGKNKTQKHKNSNLKAQSKKVRVGREYQRCFIPGLVSAHLTRQPSTVPLFSRSMFFYS
jgi:hypothetical protein